MNECLKPLLDQNHDAGLFGFGAPQETKAMFAAVLDGGVTVAALPEEVQAELNAVTPWLDRVLACTRAPATRGDTPQMGAFADFGGTRPFYPSTQATIGGLAIRADLAHGDAARALDRCADLLAMLRDATAETGLIGAMHAASGVKILLPPCGAAIDASDAVALHRFLEELAVIRRGFFSFSQVLELERVQMQLLVYSRELSSAQLARLPATARAYNAVPLLSDEWGAKRLAVLLSWPSMADRARRRAEAASSPDRDALFRQLDKEEWLIDLLFEGMGPGLGSWEEFAQRNDARARGIDLIESAARGVGRPSCAAGRRRGSARWRDRVVGAVVGRPTNARPSAA